MRFREKGEYLRSFVAEDSLFIDIMMNVGIIFYAAIETARRTADGHRPAALPDDAPRAGARRWFDRARRHLRSRNRRVSAAVHASGLSRRFLLVARPGLGALWFRNRLRLHARSAISGDRRGLRRLLHRPHAGATACRRGITTRPADSRKLVDTSAAAIAASGLLQLAQLVADRIKGRFYESAARHILSTLCRQLPGRGRRRLGRHSQGRRLSPAQESGRE